MVNPRQRRKQRSGTGRVTRRTANKHNKKVVINNELIKEVWNVNDTLKQNYERLGLAHSLHTSVGVEGPSITSPLIQKLEAYAAAEIHEEHDLSDNQTSTLRRLIAKYKDDYKAMARDMKINKYQLTEGQLRRQITKLNAATAAREEAAASS